MLNALLLLGIINTFLPDTYVRGGRNLKHLKKLTTILLVRIPADRSEMQRVMKCKEERGNTFNCDCSCAACHTKLVSCHTGVRTSV